MPAKPQLVKIVSALLVVAGVLLMGIPLLTGSPVNVALPLVFLMLGVTLYALVPVFLRQWSWAGLLYLPGSLLLALGIIFLFNVLTNDWNAWAYAWFLLVAGLGLGLSLSAWQMRWRQEFALTGIGLCVAGLTLFALFGAIAGGLFIQVTAPLLLILGGLTFFWVRPKFLLPDAHAWRLLGSPPGTAVEEAESLLTAAVPASLLPLPDAGSLSPALSEPLSARELEVLRLIDQGLSNAEIAARLTLAPSTVKTHINNIYGKLAVQGRVQAIKRARELGLLD